VHRTLALFLQRGSAFHILGVLHRFKFVCVTCCRTTVEVSAVYHYIFAPNLLFIARTVMLCCMNIKLDASRYGLSALHYAFVFGGCTPLIYRSIYSVFSGSEMFYQKLKMVVSCQKCVSPRI